MNIIQDFIYVVDINARNNMLKALKWTEFRPEPHLHSGTKENVLKGHHQPSEIFLGYFMIGYAAGSSICFRICYYRKL